MSTQDAVLLVLMFIVFGVPALGITARLVLRPMVDSIVRLIEAFNARIPLDGDSRIAHLEQEVQFLRSSVRQLSEGAAFDREIQDGSRGPISLPPRPTDGTADG